MLDVLIRDLTDMLCLPWDILSEGFTAFTISHDGAAAQDTHCPVSSATVILQDGLFSTELSNEAVKGKGGVFYFFKYNKSNNNKSLQE